LAVDRRTTKSRRPRGRRLRVEPASIKLDQKRRLI
jgi:hypothetical protein